MQIDLHAGTASLILTDFALKDFGTFCNDLSHGPSVAATVSLNMQWNGVIDEYSIKSASQGYAGEFKVTGATLKYRASVPGNNFKFVSGPASTSINLFAQIGKERNGVFFR